VKIQKYFHLSTQTLRPGHPWARAKTAPQALTRLRKSPNPQKVVSPKRIMLSDLKRRKTSTLNHYSLTIAWLGKGSMCMSYLCLRTR
jgi:hypothetical protein